LSSYSDPSGAFQNENFNNPNPLLSLLTVAGCNFESNILAISNSLAIIGFQPVNLELNFYINNGGPTGEIIAEIFTKSFFS
jgi:uncharacterized lipoprotein YajG